MTDATRSDPRPARLPLLMAFGLLLVELTIIGTVFKHLIEFDCLANWPRPVCTGASRSLVAVYCLLGVTALLWMLRPEPLARLTETAGARLWPLWINLAGVAIAFIPLALLSGAQGPMAPFLLWGAGMTLILTGISLYIAPWARWLDFLAAEWTALLPAGVLAISAPWVSVQLQPIWSIEWIADRTFNAVAAIMSLLNYDLYTDPGPKVIGANDFYISIDKVCSGIEGIALVTLFVSLYLWLFRKELRFPLALILYPIGIAASVFFNIIRISVLLAIGLEGNPELAVGGFHSHAGWMMFTLVALGIVALAQTQSWLRVADRPMEHDASAPLPFFQDPVVARILPFIVFMLSALVASAFSEAPSMIYPLRVALMVAVVALFWGIYRALPWNVDPIAVGVGAVIAAYWVAIPVDATDTVVPYGGLTGAALVLWFIARGFGTIVLVPLIEELFFRDYLERRLQIGSSLGYAIGAAVVTGVLFAALHGRWAEAFVASLLFSWVAARRGNITDAIVSHAVANALIFAAAIIMGNMAIL